MRTTLRGARLIDAEGVRERQDITIEGGQIVAVDNTPGGSGTRLEIDAHDLSVVPGFIDVHTHGGGGYSLQTTDPDEILAFARWVPSTGVTSFLVTVVGVPDGLPEAQLHAAAHAIERFHAEGLVGAEPLGIHMEGPYLNPARRGAHQASWLRAPESSEIGRPLALVGAHLRMLTLAPELPAAHEAARRLAAAGVTVAMGHTEATYEEALRGIEAGITHATHCGNAMAPILARAPGPLAALAESGGITCEVIADGVHLHPATLRALLVLLGPERAVIVTDALAAAGTSQEHFDFAGQRATVRDGAARLADGTLAGSVLTMDRALRLVAHLPGISLPAAVGMLTRNPARAARVSAAKGLLVPGYDADLTLLDSTLHLCATLRRGTVAYAKEEWRERLA